MLYSRLLFRAAAAVALSATLGACATTDTSLYPSLARRPAEGERMTGSAPPATPDPAAPALPQPLPADLPGKLAAIEANAAKAHRTFNERAGLARRQAAPGAEPGSLAWSNAEVALSSLESARSDTMFALADLDMLLVDSAVRQADTGVNAGLPEIAALRDRVAGLVGEEDAVLAQLRR